MVDAAIERKVMASCFTSTEYDIRHSTLVLYTYRYTRYQHRIYSTILARVAVTGLWSLALLCPCSTPTTRHAARAAASRNT